MPLLRDNLTQSNRKTTEPEQFRNIASQNRTKPVLPDGQFIQMGSPAGRAPDWEW